MSEVSRRFLRVLAATTFLVVCPALVVLVPTETDDSCNALRRFARGYIGTSPTLGDLANLDRSHRVAVQSLLSPAIRASLWQTHLRRFAERPDLTPAQRALVREGIAIATPQLYERKLSAIQARKEFWSRAETQFNTRELRAPWFDLASGQAPMTPRLRSMVDTVSNAFTARAQFPPGCNCVNSTECAVDETCQGISCHGMFACGVMGDQWCIGRCASAR